MTRDADPTLENPGQRSGFCSVGDRPFVLVAAILTSALGFIDGTLISIALPAMRDRGWGRIVNLGFADSDRMHAHPVNFPYFVAKTGVLMFTRMLAADTSDDGITVNAVSPFAVSNTEAGVEDFPRGRPADFEDVAAPLRFFLSDAAAYVSGENVAVDGGRLPEFDA